MMDLNRMAQQRLETEPYQWAVVDRLFSANDAADLAATFPRDHYKRFADYGGEKDLQFEARALIGMGEHSVSRHEELSSSWSRLANDFLSPHYREAMSALTGLDLTTAELEVNLFHYPPGGELGAHTDFRDKLASHVLYFNPSWDDDDGGCLSILRSPDPRDIVRTVSPVVGNSAVVIRSDHSWHVVSPVAKNCLLSRRSLTAAFHRPGSRSAMWPPGDSTPLHTYRTSRRRRWLDGVAAGLVTAILRKRRQSQR